MSQTELTTAQKAAAFINAWGGNAKVYGDEVAIIIGGNTIHQSESEMEHWAEKWNLEMQVAAKFIDILRTWFKEDGKDFNEMCVRTKADMPWKEGICYSHDYFDANMAMDEAMTEVAKMPFEGVIGFREDLTDDEKAYMERHNDLWNKSWGIAQQMMVELAN